MIANLRALAGAVLRRPDVRASGALILIGYGLKVLSEIAGEQREAITAARNELADLAGAIAAARSTMRATAVFAQTAAAASAHPAGFTDEEAGGNGAGDPDELGAQIRDLLTGAPRDLGTTVGTNGVELVDELAAPETD